MGSALKPLVGARTGAGNGLRLGVWLLFWFCGSALGVQDPETLIADQLRKESVTPLCRALVLLPADGPPEQTYKKALCLLYGIQTQPQTSFAMALLRQAAVGGSVEAQLTLGDTLQRGSTADQVEALRWYSMAVQTGDARAAGRHTRLLQRRHAMAPTLPAPLPDADGSTPQGYGDGMPVNPQGYHCHVGGLGKKYCHSAFD
jgi:hypothetical protein